MPTRAPLAHGFSKVEACIQQRILLIKGAGIWNEHKARAHSLDIKTKVALFDNANWICVADGRDWDAGVPAIEPILTKLFQWMANNGCDKQIIILNQPVSKAQIERANEKPSESLPTIFVNTPEQANELVVLSGYTDISQHLAHFLDNAVNSASTLKP